MKRIDWMLKIMLNKYTHKLTNTGHSLHVYRAGQTKPFAIINFHSENCSKPAKTETMSAAA